MAQYCQVTGKGPQFGCNDPHSHQRTKRKFKPNLHYKRFWVASMNKFVRLRVSSKGIKLIDKLGIETVLARILAKGE
jgi:large subunit ribosomal protein L28